MQKLLALTAAMLSSASAISAIPPDYVIMHFEADKLAEAGDYEAAQAKRAEAIEAKRVGMAAYKRRKADEQRVALQSSLLPPMDEEEEEAPAEEPAEEKEEAPAKPLGLIPPTYVQLYYQAEVLQRKG